MLNQAVFLKKRHLCIYFFFVLGMTMAHAVTVTDINLLKIKFNFKVVDRSPTQDDVYLTFLNNAQYNGHVASSDDPANQFMFSYNTDGIFDQKQRNKTTLLLALKSTHNTLPSNHSLESLSVSYQSPMVSFLTGSGQSVTASPIDTMLSCNNQTPQKLDQVAVDLKSFYHPERLDTAIVCQLTARPKNISLAKNQSLEVGEEQVEGSLQFSASFNV